MNHRNINQVHKSQHNLNYFAYNISNFSTTTINSSNTNNSGNNKSNNQHSNSNTDFTTSDYGGMLFFGSICMTTLILGIWQVSRYYWKIDLIENNKKAVKEPIININQINIDTINDEHSLTKYLKDKVGKRVSLTGTYLHKNSVLLGPRSIPEGIMEKAQGMASNPQGFYIITPMVIRLNDNNNNSNSSSSYFFKKNNSIKDITDSAIVYVNRGWLPSSKVQSSAKSIDYSTINSSSKNGESENVNVIGIVGECEGSGLFTPKNDLSNSINGSGDMNKLLWLEGKSLIQSCNGSNSNSSSSEPIIINRIAPNTSLYSYPLAKSEEAVSSSGGDHYVTPFTHLVYAVTWFSLTMFGTAMTYSMFRGKLKRRMRLKKQQQQQQ